MMNHRFIDKEYLFSKAKFPEETFMKLFFNYHKNHQEPFNYLETNRSFRYFEEKNSLSSQEKEKIMEKKEKSEKSKNKSIGDINRLSPDDQKNAKYNLKNKKIPNRILKKTENFNLHHKNDDNNLFQQGNSTQKFEELKFNKEKALVNFGESSLSRLKLLDLENLRQETE